jgi:hypothetical protein
VYYFRALSSEIIHTASAAAEIGRSFWRSRDLTAFVRRWAMRWESVSPPESSLARRHSLVRPLRGLDHPLELDVGGHAGEYVEVGGQLHELLLVEENVHQCPSTAGVFHAL